MLWWMLRPQGDHVSSFLELGVSKVMLPVKYSHSYESPFCVSWIVWRWEDCGKLGVNPADISRFKAVVSPGQGWRVWPVSSASAIRPLVCLRRRRLRRSAVVSISLGRRRRRTGCPSPGASSTSCLRTSRGWPWWGVGCLLASSRFTRARLWSTCRRRRRSQPWWGSRQPRLLLVWRRRWWNCHGFHRW